MFEAQETSLSIVGGGEIYSLGAGRNISIPLLFLQTTIRYWILLFWPNISNPLRLLTDSEMAIELQQMTIMRTKYVEIQRHRTFPS
jgi:hypothetical protein